MTAQTDISFTSTSGSAPAPLIRGAQVHAGRDITVTTTGTNHPTMSSTYNAHVQFYEPNSRTYQYYDKWFGQDYIGATFQGCSGSNTPLSTKIVG